jgi:hypothetical protein
MTAGLGVLLVLAALTFLLAAALHCVGLRKQEELIERLERLQNPLVSWREDIPPPERNNPGHFICQRPN